MRIKKALIIAAGNGSRLRHPLQDLPKPLQKVAGLPLIERIIRSAHKGGIEEFVIVVGYEKEQIIKKLIGMDLGVKIKFVINDDWRKPNGLSVLAAKKEINENFVLLMSDHIFDPQTLEKFAQTPLGNNQVSLAIDYKVDQVFDIADATKVNVENEKIKAIGKEIQDYNALDTGMFVATPSLFTALEEASREGKYSLSDGVQILASKGLMGTFDIKDGYWHDVDTPEAKKHAENFLLNLCRKKTDGVISKNFNRYVSLFISRLLLKTPLSANYVTGFTTLVGIFSGIFVAKGDYWNGLLGAFLFQMASILDGCDGEISKLKLTNSKVGQWLDTISDNATYVIFTIGLIIGLSKTGTPHVPLFGTLTILGLGMTLLVMFVYLIRNTDSGSLLAIQKDFEKDGQNGKLKKVLSSVQFMVKRDFFAMLFLVLALFNQLPAVLFLIMLGSNVMWIVILQSKIGAMRSVAATDPN